MGSSRKWAILISRTASCIFFLMIFLQIPLFRVPCRSEICTTPLEVTASQLMAIELCPPIVVKALLYPGAIAKALYRSKNMPSFNSLPKLYNFHNVKAAPATSDLQRLEVLTGSYLSVAGAIIGVVRPGRMSLFGTLTVAWGLLREVILRKSAKTSHMTDIQIYPTISLVVVLAFLSIRRDVRRIVRSSKALRIRKPSWKEKQV